MLFVRGWLSGRMNERERVGERNVGSGSMGGDLVDGLLGFLGYYRAKMRHVAARMGRGRPFGCFASFYGARDGAKTSERAT